MKIKKIIFITSIALIVFSLFTFAQIKAESIEEKVPSTLEGWWSTIKTYWEKFGGIFINALKKAWQQAVALWQRMWLWVKNAWISYLSLKIDWVAEKIKARFR